MIKKDGKISYDYYKHAMSVVVANLEFRYRDFTFIAFDRRRLDSLAKDLLDAGILTQEPIIHRQWIKAGLIQVMVEALAKDGLQNGTSA